MRESLMRTIWFLPHIVVSVLLLLALSPTGVTCQESATVTASAADLSLLLNETSFLDIKVQGLAENENIQLKFWVQHDDLISVDPTTLPLVENDRVYKVSVTGLHPG